jgi:TonB family protein
MNRLGVAFGVLCFCGISVSAQKDAQFSSGCSVHTVAHDDAPRSQPSEPVQNHTVDLEVKFSSSGKVRSVKVLSGPASLRPAAIEAVKKQRPTYLQGKVTQFVAFAGDGATITYIGQVYTGPPGSPGCVSGAPLDRIRVTQEEMQRLLVTRIDPVYPPEARAQRIEGTVSVYLSVDKLGNVFSARPLSGPDILAPAAVDAVKQWKFQPYLLNGTPIKFVTTADVRFALER